MQVLRYRSGFKTLLFCPLRRAPYRLKYKKQTNYEFVIYRSSFVLLLFALYESKRGKQRVEEHVTQSKNERNCIQVLKASFADVL